MGTLDTADEAEAPTSIAVELAAIGAAFDLLKAERDHALAWAERRAAWLDEEREEFDDELKTSFGEGALTGALVALAFAAFVWWALSLT